MITLFYGPDTYRSREAFQAARASAAQKTGGAVTLLRDEALTPAALQAALEGQTLFGGLPRPRWNVSRRSRAQKPRL